MLFLLPAVVSREYIAFPYRYFTICKLPAVLKERIPLT
jgi:hypothetical protein